MKRLWRYGLIVAIGSITATAGLVGSLDWSSSVAHADVSYRVYGTGGAGLIVRSTPSRAGVRLGGVPEGAQVNIHCQIVGESINGSRIWDQLSGGGYISDWYVNTPVTGGFSPGLPQCGQAGPPPPPSGPKYSRTEAVAWAANNALNKGSYYYSGDDCTFFVSRALWAGQLPKSDAWTNATTDPRYVASRWKSDAQPSKDASSADYLKNYLVSETQMATIREIDFNQSAVPGAQLGDLIGYDWNSPGPDGFLDHLVMITGFSGTYPLVSAHSLSLYNGGWRWSYANSAPIVDVYTHNGNKPRAYLIHLTY